MKRLGRLLVFIGIIIVFSTGKLLAGESDLHIPHSEIPAAVVSCSFVLSNFLQFECVLGADATNPIKKLIDGFKRIPCDIAVRLGFAHYDFIVQGDVVGNYSGFLSTGADGSKQGIVQRESILFVTTPLDSFSKKSLVIISSVSPERVTIISIDKQLRMELLYESFNAHYGDGTKAVKLCSVYGIKVIAPGKMKLLERPGRCGGFDFKREFLLDVSGGTFKITLADEKVIK
jgi:hypothetical protein